MNIVLDAKHGNAQQSSKNHLQQRFDKLQQKLQKQQKLNQKFEQEIHQLVSIYQTHLLKMDTELVEPLTQLTAKLITFYSRKSLSKWHKAELGEWVTDNIVRICEIDLEVGMELRQQFRQVIADQANLTLEELEQEEKLQEEDLQQAFEQFQAEEFDIDPDSPYDVNDPQVDMFGFDDFQDQTTDDDPFSQHYEAEENKNGNSDAKQDALMNGSWARSLFRRAAQALHPDREPDPELRQTKERAMQQLLTARKQGDILTLLQLYSECTGSDDLILAKAEMTSACEMMEKQLEELRLEKNQFLYGDPLRMMVNDLFYSRSKKSRERNIRQWQRELAGEATYIANLLIELRNLKELKVTLENRLEEKILNSPEFMFDIF